MKKWLLGISAILLLGQTPNQLPDVDGKYIWNGNVLQVYSLDGSLKQYTVQQKTVDMMRLDPNAALGTCVEFIYEFHPEMLPTLEGRIQEANRDQSVFVIYNRLRSLGSSPENDGKVWNAVNNLR